MNSDHYDVTLVLGGSMNLDGTVPKPDKARLEEVAKLQRDGRVDVIIATGLYGYKAIEKPQISEAEAYANYLYELNVPCDHVYTEDKSQETFGNFLFTKMNILAKHDWHKLLIVPTVGQSTERMEYIAGKVLGDSYDWEILRIGENRDPANLDREMKSLHETKLINDEFSNGDDKAMLKKLYATHPAYGGTRWTIDELREKLGHKK
jgi:hypothetical protein